MFRGVFVGCVLVAASSCGRVAFAPIDENQADANGGSAAGGDGQIAGCGPPGLVVHLRLDEITGTFAADSSGAGNDGVLVGFGGATPWVSGKRGNALAFEGSQHVDAGMAPSIANLSSLTACAWIKVISAPDAFAHIIDKSSDGFLDGWKLYWLSDGRVGFYTNTARYREGGLVPLATWRHLCATWDGTAGAAGIRLFIHGAELANSAGGGVDVPFQSDAAQALTIGQVKNGAYGLDGLIDEVRVYDRALGASEVAEVYACSM